MHNKCWGYTEILPRFFANQAENMKFYHLKKNKLSTVLTTVFKGRNGKKALKILKYSVIKYNGIKYNRIKYDRIQQNKTMELNLRIFVKKNAILFWE